MAQGGVFVDTTGGHVPFKVKFERADVTVGPELTFLFGTQLHGLTKDPPIDSLLNTRMTDILVTASTGKNLFTQVQASFVQISTQNGSLSFTQKGNLVQIVASTPMVEQRIVVNIPLGGLLTLYIYTLRDSGAGSTVDIDEFGQVDCTKTLAVVSTTIQFP